MKYMPLDNLEKDASETSGGVMEATHVKGAKTRGRGTGPQTGS